MLQVLANVDADLCAEVADGLGLPAPAPTENVTDVGPSPALSQVGKTWPVTGRLVGVLVGAKPVMKDLRAARQAIFDAGMVPLLIAPKAGVLTGGRGKPVPVQRTYLTARSIEFDALLIAGDLLVPGDDATPSRDAKADPAAQQLDPRVALMLAEAFRHTKAIAGWGAAEQTLTEAAVPAGAPGVVTAKSPDDAVTALVSLVAAHRVWERFPPAPRGSQ